MKKVLPVSLEEWIISFYTELAARSPGRSRSSLINEDLTEAIKRRRNQAPEAIPDLEKTIETILQRMLKDRDIYLPVEPLHVDENNVSRSNEKTNDLAKKATNSILSIINAREK